MRSYSRLRLFVLPELVQGERQVVAGVGIEVLQARRFLQRLGSLLELVSLQQDEPEAVPGAVDLGSDARDLAKL